MSLVDDARRSDCYCYHPAEGLDCPNGDACIDLLMPRIVAALEAIEKEIWQLDHFPLNEESIQTGHAQHILDGMKRELVAALRGDEVTA